MARNLKPITRAQVDWSEDGHPVSKQFGDVYASRDNGLAESRHVFLGGNGLPEAWAAGHQFTICELGFGTGLNFLATWELWQRSKPAGARLNYVSIEGHPLERNDLEQALHPWPELSGLTTQVVRHYPWLHRGYHRLHLDSDVTLTLIMDDVLHGLEGLEARVDAWFLDGFAPRCNPEMWSQDVCVEMARLSKPAATLSTYTVAGEVRGRLARSGFAVEKGPGFGRKRSMLRGRFDGRHRLHRGAPWYRQPESFEGSGRALIIGAGIAGCSVAEALNRRNWSCTLVDRDAAIAQGASGNETGIVMPRLTSDLSPDGRFHAECYRATIQFLMSSHQGNSSIEHDLCGVLQIGTPGLDPRRPTALAEAEALPKEMLKALTLAEASDVAGIKVDTNAAYFPQGGWLDPTSLCLKLAEGSEILLETNVRAIAREDERWHAKDADGQTIMDADIVIIANGAGAYQFSELSSLPLEAFRGQITYLSETAESAGLKTVIAFGNYVTPSRNGQHLIGATYQPVPLETEGSLDGPRDDDDQFSISALKEKLPDITKAELQVARSGRVSVRCTTPDRNPVVGHMPDAAFFNEAYAGVRHGQIRTYPAARYVPGLYVHLGLGSRGYTTALLSAEILASQIAGDPMPVERALAELVHPGRFLMRDLRYDREIAVTS